MTLGEQIRRRQDYARNLATRIAAFVAASTRLRDVVRVLLWHGSLPRGRGGEKYDIDYGIFLRSRSPSELMEEASLVTKIVTDNMPLSPKKKLHYDGMAMFEAHEYWDPDDRSIPRIGVHFYRDAAWQELLGKEEWQAAKRPPGTLFRHIESWRRYCFFHRHWIYEGEPFHDPDSYYKRAKDRGYQPPTWLVHELREAVCWILRNYSSSPEGVCKKPDCKQLALDLTATLAYCLEGKPMGRATRYQADAEEFENVLARELLQAVSRPDLTAAARLGPRLEDPKHE